MTIFAQTESTNHDSMEHSDPYRYLLERWVTAIQKQNYIRSFDNDRSTGDRPTAAIIQAEEGFLLSLALVHH